jgi:hypothetical protein
MPREAEILTRGDINWIETDATGHFLYVTGHERPWLQKYDLRDFSIPPLQSDSPTGGAERFAYEARAGEIYIYNRRAKELMYLDAETLAVKRRVPIQEMAPGDNFIIADPHSDTIVLSSEADRKTGVAFLVIDRSEGEVLGRGDYSCVSAVLHPSKPLLYMSFFRRVSELVQYDLARREVVRTVRTDPRADRIVFSSRDNELLLASPVHSRVWRYNADTLEPRGSIATIFGVRTIALDSVRNLLLCGSIATGEIEIIDMDSGRRKATHYLGPWLRTIQLDAERGIAYVSSNGALYRLRYGGK